VSHYRHLPGTSFDEFGEKLVRSSRPEATRELVARVNQRFISLRHLRRTLRVAGIASRTWRSSSTAVTRFNRVASAAPRLVKVNLADPVGTLADDALDVHAFIVAGFVALITRAPAYPWQPWSAVAGQSASA
jgi:hypothetical protein